MQYCPVFDEMPQKIILDTEAELQNPNHKTALYNTINDNMVDMVIIVTLGQLSVHCMTFIYT